MYIFTTSKVMSTGMSRAAIFFIFLRIQVRVELVSHSRACFSAQRIKLARQQTIDTQNYRQQTIDTETGRYTGKQTIDTQRDRYTDTKTRDHRHTDNRIRKQTDRQIHRQKYKNKQTTGN
jgi:hypothetical protein